MLEGLGMPVRHRVIAIAASTYNSTLSVNDAPYPPVMSKINP